MTCEHTECAGKPGDAHHFSLDLLKELQVHCLKVLPLSIDRQYLILLLQASLAAPCCIEASITRLGAEGALQNCAQAAAPHEARQHCLPQREGKAAAAHADIWSPPQPHCVSCRELQGTWCWRQHPTSGPGAKVQLACCQRALGRC